MVISLSVMVKSVTGDFSKNELKSSVFVYSVDVCDAESTLWLKTVSSSEIIAASTEHKERLINIRSSISMKSSSSISSSSTSSSGSSSSS